MSWIILSLLTAFSQSLKDVLNKKKLKRIDEYSISFLKGTETNALGSIDMEHNLDREKLLLFSGYYQFIFI